MAYIGMAHIVVAYIVVACMIMAYMIMACVPRVGCTRFCRSQTTVPKRLTKQHVHISCLCTCLYSCLYTCLNTGAQTAYLAQQVTSARRDGRVKLDHEPHGPARPNLVKITIIVVVIMICWLGNKHYSYGLSHRKMVVGIVGLVMRPVTTYTAASQVFLIIDIGQPSISNNRYRPAKYS